MIGDHLRLHSLLHWCVGDLQLLYIAGGVCSIGDLQNTILHSWSGVIFKASYPT